MKSLGNYIIINYHYIHDPKQNQKLGGVFPCLPADFEKQVDFLREHYQLVNIADLVKAVREERPGQFAAITFDDGLKDQYQNAFPVLKKYGFPATFFIITSTLEGKIPVSHKIHCLRSRLAVAELSKRYENFFGEALPQDRFLDKNERYDDITTSNFKTAVNRLSPDRADAFLSSIFNELGWNERAIGGELFMNHYEIRELKENGMTIGTHAHSHGSLSRISKKAIGEELILSRSIIANIINEPVRIFSYPHGEHEPHHAQILEAAGFKYAVVNERRVLELSDHPLRLPRYDVRDLERLING